MPSSPFVYRDDRINTQVLGDTGEVTSERTFDGYGLGDIELGAHYQITGAPPFLIGNLRFNTDPAKARSTSIAGPTGSRPRRRPARASGASSRA